MKSKSMKSKMDYTIGIDLGGTKIASALVDSRGKILYEKRQPLSEFKSLKPVKLAQKSIVDLMANHCDEYFKKFPKLYQSSSFAGIGLASAGPLNVDRGELVYPANFPNWKIVPLVELLQSALSKRKIRAELFFQNDAVASALAEGWCGAAMGRSTYAVLTIGTGIGTGVIFRSLPVQSGGMGSEFGHLIVDQSKSLNSTTFYRSTVEGIASGTALVERAVQEMNFPCSSVEEIVTAISNGTRPDLQTLFDDAATALASLSYNLSVGFHLEKILISGGLMKVRKYYLKQLKRSYRSQILSFNPAFLAPIELAKTGNKSGVIGAAFLPRLVIKEV